MTTSSSNRIPLRDTKDSSASQTRTRWRRSRTMPPWLGRVLRLNKLSPETASSSTSSEINPSTTNTIIYESESSPRTTSMESLHKVYAAFLKNTIDPMLDKIKAILELTEVKGIPITRSATGEFLEKVFLAHICVLLLEWTFRIIIAGIVCYTIYKVL